MFLAAFTSRSCTVPYAAHAHWRTRSGFGPSLPPHAEHTCDVGSNRPIFAKVRPCLLALYSSIAVNAPGSGSSPASTTKLAKYRPAASRVTVTDDGWEGRSRDQRTGTSPIFGSRSLPPAVMVNRALRVKRMA